MRSCTGFAAVVVVVAGLVACIAPAEKPTPFTGWYKGYANCREQYAEMDARVDAAGVRDAEFWRVPGYPYLRTDRMLASFRNEVRGLEDVSEWLRRMRELDQESRDYEYINLGMAEFDAINQRDRFLNCGRILATIELDDPQVWEQLLSVVYPPDAYSDLMRALGLYPLLAPGMRSRVAALHATAAQVQAQPLPHALPDAALRLWRAQPKEQLALLAEMKQTTIINALGYPGLYGSQWRALAELNAPQLWIETASEADVPAAPLYTAQGLSADTTQARVNYQIGYTRFGGDNLIQIAYSVWFKAQENAARAPIDGLIWRVTLDRSFEPMLYESLHASGNDHRWYPVQQLTLREDIAGEAPFVASGQAPARDAALRLRRGSHEVLGVVTAEPSQETGAASYELRPYEVLYTLPLPAGGTRSLFGPDGLIAETRGVDPIGGFGSGILRPGALRQNGHHAIAHVGKRHFDDPDLVAAIFVAPPVPSETSHLARQVMQ
ncbi:MAG: hypothetical protein ACT4QA_02105 [Panacagrimonas sp.]